MCKLVYIFNMKIIYTILAIVLLSSSQIGCESNNKSFQEGNFIDFSLKDSILLEGEIVFEEEYGLRGVFALDTFIILRKANDNDGLFRVYNSKDLNFLGSFATKGKGPGEFLGPYFMGQYEKDTSGLKIWVNDVIQEKFSLINVSKSIASLNTIVEKSFDIKSESIFYINENQFVGTYPSLDGRSFVYFPITDSIAYKTELFPKSSITEVANNDPQLLYELYFDRCSIHPSQDLFVSAMEQFRRIDIFDSNANLNSSIVGSNQTLNEIEDLLEGSNMNYYEDIAVSEKYIYALNVNQKNAEVAEIQKPIEIEVFDWIGNPQAIILIDDYILQFDVEGDSVIYGLNYVSDVIKRYVIGDLTEFE